MKKFMSLLLAAGMAASMAACGVAADTASSASSAEAASPAASAESTADIAAGGDLAYIQGKGKMVIGYTVYEPMNYTDADGKFTGFDTELAKAVCQQLGVGRTQLYALSQQLYGCGVMAQVQLGDQAQFFPSDAALASWMAQADEGRAAVVYE